MITSSSGTTFISYDPADIDRINPFLDTHRSVLGDIRSVGVTADDGIAHSSDEHHILDEIGRRYVAGADLTVVLVGERTWTRRFVDWEVAASASHGCGILAVPLSTATNPVPARVQLLAEARCAVIADHAPISTAEFAEWISAARNRDTSAGPALRAMKTPLMRRDATVTVF